MKKRSVLDMIVLVIVVIIALIVVALSFQNTTKISVVLGLHPYLTAGLVEILFASLLFIRGRQRALQRNVPIFLEIGYFTSLGFVTAINMYGLAQNNLIVGSVVGLAISGAMWLMESVLVWLWVDGHQPYQQSARERIRHVKKVIQDEKIVQLIEWMKYEAQKPDLKLIRKARNTEKKREEAVGNGLPSYFLSNSSSLSTAVGVSNSKAEPDNQLIPIKRQIGFYQQEKKKDHLFQANTEARYKAIQTAKELSVKLGRVPTYKELKNKGITTHYSRIARDTLKYG
jgi:hypothetical protein